VREDQSQPREVFFRQSDPGHPPSGEVPVLDCGMATTSDGDSTAGGGTLPQDQPNGSSSSSNVSLLSQVLSGVEVPTKPPSIHGGGEEGNHHHPLW